MAVADSVADALIGTGRNVVFTVMVTVTVTVTFLFGSPEAVTTGRWAMRW